MSEINHSSDASTGTEGAAMDHINNLANTVRSTTNNKSEMTQLSSGFYPGPYDVICARGKKALQHSGNVKFRKMIEANLEPYSRANTKPLKSALVTSIVNAVRQASPEGGFVKEVDGVWYEVGDHIAREKIGQSFRDALHTQYRSSTRAKLIRKKIIEGKCVDNMKPVDRSLPNGLENKHLDNSKTDLVKLPVSSSYSKLESESYHPTSESDRDQSSGPRYGNKILPARVVAKNFQNSQPRPMHTPSDGQASHLSNYPGIDSQHMLRQNNISRVNNDPQQQRDINAALLNLLSLQRGGGPPQPGQTQNLSHSPLMNLPYSQNNLLSQGNLPHQLQAANRPVIIVVLPSAPRS